MAGLQQRVAELSQNSFHTIVSSDRKHQIGSGQRGDKIRTIQFQNDTATDHRTSKRITADMYMKGNMNMLWPETK